MLLADDGTGRRVQAHPGITGYCPNCKDSLIPKCGEIIIWHWSHRADADCDPWSEGESEWHLGWKNEFTPDQIEIPIGNHRADIIAGRTVIELQHSSLDPAEVREREAFYQREVGHMIWVIDMTEANVTFSDPNWTGQRWRTFRWSRPKKWLAECTMPVYWDLGGGHMFHMKQLKLTGQTLLTRRFSSSTNGTGKIGTVEEFLTYYRDRPVQEQLVQLDTG